MKTTITILIVIALLAGLIIFAKNSDDNGSATEGANASSLVADRSLYDFGTIPLSGGDVTTQYTLTNEGSGPLRIGKVYTSCMCTTASIIESNGSEKGIFGMPGHKGQLARADTIVGPGESIKVNATYDPAAHGPSGVGLAQRSIYLETDSKETPKVELRLKAMVTN